MNDEYIDKKRTIRPLDMNARARYNSKHCAKYKYRLPLRWLNASTARLPVAMFAMYISSIDMITNLINAIVIINKKRSKEKMTLAVKKSMLYGWTYIICTGRGTERQYRRTFYEDLF